jgi:PKD domain
LGKEPGSPDALASFLYGAAQRNCGETYAFAAGSNGQRVSVSHLYRKAGAYTIQFFWTDPTGPGNRATLAVGVLNVPPAVDAGDDATIGHEQELNRKVSFTDPGPDLWMARVDYGDGEGAQELDLKDRDFKLHHKYRNPGIYHVVVRVIDDNGAVGTATFDITVA